MTRNSVEASPSKKIEGLMRRITGSIIEYMRYAVCGMRYAGVRPSHMNYFDEVVLAINDLTAFCDAYPKVPQRINLMLDNVEGSRLI